METAGGAESVGRVVAEGDAMAVDWIGVVIGIVTESKVEAEDRVDVEGGDNVEGGDVVVGLPVKRMALFRWFMDEI